MSRTLWNVLGGCAILAGLSLLLQAPDIYATRPPDKQLEFILGSAALVGVCGLIAIACFFPKSYPITLRILGGIGVAGCIFNLVEGFRNRDFFQFGIILLFWLPGSIYLVLQGKMTDD